MKTLPALLAVVLLLPLPSLRAIPNSFFGNGAVPIIPAFPRFNADLTEEFFDEAKWRTGDFSGPWESEPSMPGLSIRRMSANPIVLGEIPMTVVAYGDGSRTTEIAVHFLDAGLFFGYRAGGETTRDEREAGRDRRTEFSRHFKTVSESVRDRLEEGCGRGSDGAVGRTAMLRTSFTEYRWENFVIRLVEREDHSVSVHIYESRTAPGALVDSEWMEADRRTRQAILEERVSGTEGEAVRLGGLPMFTQGTTPFCGIHSLAIVGRYLGLRANPEALAAAAEFKNTGSAKGADLVELHRAVADELGMRVAVSPNWESNRVRSSIQQGLPVIVWRRISVEREKAHAANAGADVVPAELTPEQIEALPEKDEKGSPSHASVVTGIDEESGIVYYTEPWGEIGLDRRMRIEEMEATAYAVFHFRL